MEPINELDAARAGSLLSEAPPQVIMIGFPGAAAARWLHHMGLTAAEAVLVPGQSWMEPSLAGLRAKGRVLVVVRFSTESFAGELDLLRCVSLVVSLLRPSRVAVVLSRIEMRLAVEVVRAGANHVFGEDDPPSAVRDELERGGLVPHFLFGDSAPWLETLEAVADQLHFDKDPNARLRALLTLFSSRLGVDRGSVAFLKDSSLRIAALHGQEGGLREGMESELRPDSISAQVIQSRKARLIQGRDRGGASDVRSAICAPLISREEVLGVVNFSSFANGRVLVDKDLHAAELFASLVGLSYDNQRMLERTLAMERLSTIGTAMASVSHSLKNLLTVFKGGLHLMDRQLRDGNLEGVSESFKLVQTGVQRVENLVMELLGYSSQRDPVLEPTDLRRLVNDLILSFSRARQHNNRRLITELEVEPNQLLDGVALERALLNLLLNAVDATEEDGVVRLRIRRQGDFLHFEVGDSGPGVPRERQDAIFEPFFSTKGSRGTGLGLPSVRKFAEENGGTATASTCTDLGGLLVTIALPIQSPVSTERPPQP